MRKCPLKYPHARISDERLFEELNWRPELSFCDRARPVNHREAFNRVGRYSITSVMWPGGFEPSSDRVLGRCQVTHSWVFSAVAHHGLI